MNPLLEVKDVCLSYHSLSGETAALSHISFHLMPEEFLAVVGPSGCGKSTLLNLICGLLHAESGTILMNGKPLNKDSARIGYMLQKDHLLEWRSIYRNVLLGLEIQGELTKDNLSYVDEHLKTRLNVSDDIGKILKKQRKPAILVTHDISEAISMADRVLILSKRPATVIKIVPIDLDMKDRTPLSSRNAPAFKSYFNLIWKELNQNA